MRSFVRLLTRLLGALAALVVLAVVLVTVALLFVDLDMFRGQLESRAAAAFNRQVTLEGSIRLKPSLQPTFVAENFRIGNPAWASRPEFARVQRLEVQVALWPLFRGELQVVGITFNGADLLLEVGPDDTNNFTFGQSEGPPGLPDFGVLRIKDSQIGYRAATGERHDCAVTQAKAVNLPRQPLTLDGQITCREVPLQFTLAGGMPEQLAMPTAPWPLTVAVSTDAVSLEADGSLPGLGDWDGVEFQLSMQVEKFDALEALFGVVLPVPTPFELSAKFNKSPNEYSLAGLKARIGSTEVAGKFHWKINAARPFLQAEMTVQSLHVRDFSATSESPSTDQAAWLDRPVPLDWMAAIDAELALDIRRIQGGPVSIDDIAVTATLADSELTLAPVRATLDNIPLTGELAIALREEAPAIRLAAQTERLDLSAIRKRLGETMPVQGDAENLRLAANSRGRTPRQLWQHLDFSLKTQGGHVTLGDAQAGQAFDFQVTTAKVEAREAQPISINVDAKHRSVPLALALETGSLDAFLANTRPWPLALTLNAEDVTLVAKGNWPKRGAWDETEFQVSIQGSNVAALDALFGSNLPVRGDFELAARLNKSKNGYSFSELAGHIGSTDIAGRLQWLPTGARPVLKGKLASRAMNLRDFLAGPDTGSTGNKALLDRSIPLDWMAAIDAELEFAIKRVNATPIPIRDVAATVRLADKRLNLTPLQLTLAGTPITGGITVAAGQAEPVIEVTAQAGRLELDEWLKNWQVDAPLRGSVENLNLAITSRGHTPRTLLQRADFSLKTQTGRMTFGDAQAERPLVLKIATAEFRARANRPLRVSVAGQYQAVPLTLVAATATLPALVAGAKPWPLNISLQALQANLEASGNVAQPFQGRGFELGFELAGKDLQELSGLIGYVIPLQGDYRISGRFSDAARRYRLSDLKAQVGQSDLSGSLVIATASRLGINARLNARTIHYEDLAFAKGTGKRQNDVRIIPEYVLPITALQAIDLDVELRANRIRTRRGELGYLVLDAMLEDGASDWSAEVTDGRTGTRLSVRHELDVTRDPPANKLRLTARELDYGSLLTQAGIAEFAEGRVDLAIALTGPGATLRGFLSQADGHIGIIGGAGRIASRELDLWSSDLIGTMLSVGWRRPAVTELNCIVGHIDVANGVASTDKLLLDTRQLTIAGSGVLELATERLDLLLSPNPKQARLVSVANPVRVTGTLAAPRVAITKLPRGGNAAVSGLLAGLVNPAFLLFAFSDLGSGDGNACLAALEQRDAVSRDERYRRGIWQRFRNLF